MQRLFETYKKRKWKLDSLTHQILGFKPECLPLSFDLIDEVKTKEEHFIRQKSLLLVGFSLLMGWVKLWICLARFSRQHNDHCILHPLF